METHTKIGIAALALLLVGVSIAAGVTTYVMTAQVKTSNIKLYTNDGYEINPSYIDFGPVLDGVELTTHIWVWVNNTGYVDTSITLTVEANPDYTITLTPSVITALPPSTGVYVDIAITPHTAAITWSINVAVSP